MFGNEFRLRKNKISQSLGTQHGRRVVKAHSVRILHRPAGINQQFM